MLFRTKSIAKIEKEHVVLSYLTMRVLMRYFLKTSGKSTMTLTRYRFLCIEVYKTLNNLNPSLIKYFFKLRKTGRLVREVFKMNLDISRTNHVTHGTKIQ